jgi:hypothetical protein
MIHEPSKLEFWAMTLGDYRPDSFVTICGNDLTLHSEKPVPQNCQKLFRVTAEEVRDENRT